MRYTCAMSLLLWLLLLLPAGAFGANSEETMYLGSVKRWYLVHEPAVRASTGPLALVLVLHGGGGGPANAERMSQMSALADREGFLAVYPAGTGRLTKRRMLTWNSGNCCGYALKKKANDSTFLAALILKLIAEGRADPKRVYAAGMSNGAMMAHRLACEHSEAVAAIAPVAGQLNIEECRPSKPVSVLMIHGASDQRAPFAGGYGRKAIHRRQDRSVPESLRLWGEADGCEASSRFIEEGPVGRTGFSRCRDGAAVLLYTHPGGHIWPGGRPGFRNGSADPVLLEPRATELIWSFFKDHARQ
jgi:polyhydroxybutyrate depolymerase